MYVKIKPVSVRFLKCMVSDFGHVAISGRGSHKVIKLWDIKATVKAR